MRTNPSTWTDMSDFVVHFTKGGGGEDDYRNIMGIYWDRLLKAQKAFGIGRKLCPTPQSQFAVCFSEIPPGEWPRLAERRETRYGIGFRKDFVKSKGGGPIWYVWKESPQWLALQMMMDQGKSHRDAGIWKLTALIDAPGKHGASDYFFDWEREWRHVGSFQFSPEDVAFLLIPERLHVAARNFFQEQLRKHSGPAYLCPYVDPYVGFGIEYSMPSKTRAPAAPPRRRSRRGRTRWPRRSQNSVTASVRDAAITPCSSRWLRTHSAGGSRDLSWRGAE